LNIFFQGPWKIKAIDIFFIFLIFSSYLAHFSLAAAFFFDKTLSIISNDFSCASEDSALCACDGRIPLSGTGADGPSAEAQLTEKWKHPQKFCFPDGQEVSSFIVRSTAYLPASQALWSFFELLALNLKFILFPNDLVT
jgi:hypothetical protein